MTAMPEERRALGKDLRIFVRMADEGSNVWLVGAILGSVVLAALDMLGVAAMLPLMQLFVADPDLDSGILGRISAVFGTRDIGTLIGIVASIVAVAFIVKSAASVPFRWWLVGRSTRIAADAATALFRRYLLSPYGEHRARRLPEVYRNIGDSTYQGSIVLQGVLSLISDSLILLAILVVLLVASPLATVITLVIFGTLVGGIQVVLRPRQRLVGEQIAEASLRGWQFLRPALDGFREVRLTSSADQFVEGYRSARLKSASAQRTLAVLGEVPRYLLEIGFVLTILVLTSILFGTGNEAMALSVLGVFSAAALRVLPTLNRVSATFGAMRSGQVGLGLVCTALEELETTSVHQEHPRPDSEPFRGDVEFEDVHFRYEDADEETLRGTRLTIPRNKTTAIVGSSGAGKSTLLDLMLGLLSPTTGRVSVGGRDIREDRAQWFSQLGVVPQEVFLLNESLADNVSFGSSADQDEGRVWRALELAELADVVNALPEGLDTVLGERGVRLSGGQRQRIGLARALYRDPQILVLDEATSSLDNATEHQIAETLQRLSGSLTLVIVAHRLSTVRRADQLLYLENGLVVGSGSFEQMRATNQAFARLVELGELD